jgi:hypothetical protein
MYMISYSYMNFEKYSFKNDYKNFNNENNLKLSKNLQ